MSSDPVDLTEPGDPAPLFTLAAIAADYQLVLIAEQWRRMSVRERREWMEFHAAAGQIGSPDAFLARLLHGADGTAF